MPKSARAKGLDYVREVRRILEGLGYQVEGPGYSLAYYGGRMAPIHRDFFGCFDLMSFDGQSFMGHQVSTDTHKAEKIKAIQQAKLPGQVWCRYSEDGRVGYKVYIVTDSEVIEDELTYGIRRPVKQPVPDQP